MSVDSSVRVLPREPEAFTELIASLMESHFGYSGLTISGPFQIQVDDMEIDLTDLHRSIPDNREVEIAAIEQYVRTYLEAQRLTETPLPFEAICGKILPRIKPTRWLRHHSPEFVAHQSFVNDTAILYVIDFNGAVIGISTEQMIRWKLTIDDLDQIARQNLAVCQPDLELSIYSGEEGTAAFFNAGDGHDADRLLLDELYEQLAPELGGNFLVAIPTRDVFLAFSQASSPFVGRLHERITRDYRCLPGPITPNLFLVTQDGVAAWRPAA